MQGSPKGPLGSHWLSFRLFLSPSLMHLFSLSRSCPPETQATAAPQLCCAPFLGFTTMDKEGGLVGQPGGLTVRCYPPGPANSRVLCEVAGQVPAASASEGSVCKTSVWRAVDESRKHESCLWRPWLHFHSNLGSCRLSSSFLIASVLHEPPRG